MTERLFGTDGVRGLANDVITPALAMELAQAASIVLGFDTVEEGVRPRAVIANDSRSSADFIVSAMKAGFASAGVDVLDAGIVPTPAAAYLVAHTGADFGVMISASHNPAADNGIKFLARGGQKLEDSVEDAIERVYREKSFRYPTGGAVGTVKPLENGTEAYVKHLVSTLPEGKPLDGMKIVLDCANGAAYAASPATFEALGAEVIALAVEPNGTNINDGVGSTHPEKLQAAVVEHGADLGIAHDGDSDRCQAVDEKGNLVDGDQIMAILAVAAKREGKLAKDTLVATVMSSLGLELYLREHGITLGRTAVGDRYVLESMREHGYNLGGEQSGHIVLPDHGTTGDGTLTGLALMSRMAETGLPLKTLAQAMTVLPQVLINVPVSDKAIIEKHPVVVEAIQRAEGELGDSGRVLLRASGTEELFRVMVEAADAETARKVAGRLAAVVAEV